MIEWVKAQPWWETVRLLMRDHIVMIHVREMPPGHLCEADGTAKVADGVTLRYCCAPVWHLALVAPRRVDPHTLAGLKTQALSNHTAEA